MLDYDTTLSFPFQTSIQGLIPSPTHNLVAKRICSDIEQRVGNNGTVLIVGCGNGGEGLSGFSDEFLQQNVIGTDIRGTEFTNFLGDIHNLPVPNGGVDAVVCQAVLEHIEQIDLAISELKRITKPSGYVYIDVPFLQGYHALPTDFRRFTSNGLQNKICTNDDFNTINCGASKGPTSTLIWICCEYLAYLLSFGNSNIRKILSVALRIPTFWLKYVDLVLKKSHGLEDAAMALPSAVYWYGKKESPGQ
ncbi:class I SAM-dependent methyltransferase [Natronorubrum daqingense]|uniref:Methyltransferase domain-containing protein n=1 Tax=Natronorubrum daqingense TaxID=588898 RepID=A0A1N7BSX9_9EURY|nr:class I SAM-dependent methyltransferase [Natronorubrum daqingense]APX96589.1 hypothetical protein BB347_08145 [Natronorubrum daqingense]SIR54489.1 Methyltransferase domain-containing protein [Natronorubrum daqingense]